MLPDDSMYPPEWLRIAGKDLRSVVQVIVWRIVTVNARVRGPDDKSSG
jgi:hypothetical protein